MAEKEESQEVAGKSVKDDKGKESAMMDALKKAQRTAPPKKEYIGEYTVVAGDSMGGIALKYYGSAVEEKWMAIYEANKALIGDNPRLIHPGQTLKIPKID